MEKERIKKFTSKVKPEDKLDETLRFQPLKKLEEESEWVRRLRELRELRGVVTTDEINWLWERHKDSDVLMRGLRDSDLDLSDNDLEFTKNLLGKSSGEIRSLTGLSKRQLQCMLGYLIETSEKPEALAVGQRLGRFWRKAAVIGLSFAQIFFTQPQVSAEVIHLKNGRQIEADIVEEMDRKLKVRRSSGRGHIEFIIDGNEIASVERTSDVVEDKPDILEESLSRLPGVYVHEISSENIRRYKRSVSRLPEDAQQWILGMGQFLEDKRLSQTESSLLSILASKKDPLIYLTSPRIIDGVSREDVSSVKKHKARKENYMYLDSDIRELQNKGLLSKRALVELEKLVKKAGNDYEIRKGLYLIKNFGQPNQRAFTFPVPRYNTQLYVLGRLLEMGVPEGYERLAVAAALDYGSVYTIGDKSVKELAIDYAHQIVGRIAKNDPLFKKKGWQAKNYPLEAAIGLVWGAGSVTYPSFKHLKNTYQLSDVLNSERRKMQEWEFRYMFVTTGTLDEMRQWILSNFVDTTKKPKEAVMDYESYRQMVGHTEKVRGRIKKRIDNYGEYVKDKPQLDLPYYDTAIDRISAGLDDYILNLGHFEPKEWRDQVGMVVDGKHVRCAKNMNVDWQWDHFKRTRKFVGDCGDNSCIHKALLLSMNISSICGGYGYVGFGHSLPTYFDPMSNVWRGTLYEALLHTGKPPLEYGYDVIPWHNWRMNMKRAGFMVKNTSSRHIFARGVPPGYIFRKFHK